MGDSGTKLKVTNLIRKVLVEPSQAEGSTILDSQNDYLENIAPRRNKN